MNVQAPPNLAPGRCSSCCCARALNDWGGVSPLTIDFINPEAPWPTLRELRAPHRGGRPAPASSACPSIPSTCSGSPELFDPRVREAALARVDGAGWVRAATAQLAQEEAA